MNHRQFLYLFIICDSWNWTQEQNK